MIEYDAIELVTLCESIVEDGELSGEEIYGLAEWLNNHRAACFLWPGNLLVQPLQEVWADGKVNKTELRAISRLLLRIRKDWAKRQKQEAADRMSEFVSATAMNFDLQSTQLPSIFATSIFPIVSIASNARFATSPPCAIASVSTRGVICHDTPHLSLHHPHALSCPPFPTIAFQ